MRSRGVRAKTGCVLVSSLAARTAAVLAMAWIALSFVSAAEALADPGARGPLDGGADASDSSVPPSKTPPDPPAMNEPRQWVFDLRWDRGEVYLVGVHQVDMGNPHRTPRVMGRFALELYEGPTLIERVRFDFPFLGTPEAADAGWKTPPRFEPKLRTRIGVFFPATKRGTRLELWDRARDVRWQLAWPPVETPASDGGLDGSVKAQP